MSTPIVQEYISKTRKSREIFERAQKFIPGGDTYQIRLFDPYPFYAVAAKGAKLIDADGNEYVDFWLGHFSLILGHGHPEVTRAVRDQLEKTSHYGVPHELENELAELVVKMIPSVEMVRFSNSGTEAMMYAIRLARSYTRRQKIAKFEGNWHGGYDPLHVGVKPPFDKPMSSGLTEGATRDTVLLPYNDLEAAEKAIRSSELACVIMEPMMGAGGGLPAQEEFLKGLREVCSDHGTLLMFDEVVTGFRLGIGGAQEYYGVPADITILGKVLGGGFPVGAIGGPREIMDLMNPKGKERWDVSAHGGTFCGNPVSMIAGLTTLKLLEDGSLHKRMNSMASEVRKGISDIFQAKGVDVYVSGLANIFCPHFTREPVRDIRGAVRANRKRVKEYHFYLITKGFFFLPGHVGMICAAHTREDVEALLEHTEGYAKRLKQV